MSIFHPNKDCTRRMAVMKFKENKEISLYNKVPLIFLFSCIVTVALRTVQVFFYIDRETGFYTGGGFLKILLYSVIVAASVIFAAISFLSNKTASVTLQIKSNKAFGALGCLLSIAFIYDSFSALYHKNTKSSFHSEFWHLNKYRGQSSYTCSVKPIITYILLYSINLLGFGIFK